MLITFADLTNYVHCYYDLFKAISIISPSVVVTKTLS